MNLKLELGMETNIGSSSKISFSVLLSARYIDLVKLQLFEFALFTLPSSDLTCPSSPISILFFVHSVDVMSGVARQDRDEIQRSRSFLPDKMYTATLNRNRERKKEMRLV